MKLHWLHVTCVYSTEACNNFPSPFHSVSLSGLPPNICSQPATCLLSNAILMYAIHLLIISPECSHVKPNMHNRIVKNHFIRGDHSLSPCSLFLSLSVQMPFLRSFYPLKWYGVCVCVCLSSACPHTPTRACFPGDTQLRVLGGWQRDGRGGGWRGWGDGGVACRTEDGKGDCWGVK